MGVLSSLAADNPFNTLTSPEQQGAAATGNEAGPSGADPKAAPMGKIMAAVMRGAAALQGQEQAKKVASEQQASMSKLSITLKPGPDGEPRVTVKDAPASLLNGTQQDDLQQAYATPGKQVEKKIAATGLGSPAAPPAQEKPAALTSPPPPEHPMEQAALALEANGITVIRPWDPVIGESLTDERKLIDLAKRLGIPNAEKNARDAFKRIRSGKLSPGVAKSNLARMAAARIESDSHDLQATLSPYEQKKRQEAADANTKADNERQLRALTDAEREKVLTHKREVIDKTDFSLVEPSKWRETMDAQNVSGVPFTEFEYRRGEQKAKQDIAKSFETFTANADRFALGTYDTWDQAKGAFGHQLSPQQDAVGKARWEAAHTYVEKLDREAAMKARKDEAQLRHTYQLIAAATAEKPVAVGRGDLDLMPAAELLQMDPRVVKNYDRTLEAKAGLLRKTAKKAADQRDDARGKIKSIEATPEEKRRYGWRTDLAGFRFDLQQGDRDAKAAEDELQAIEAKRAERRGTPIVAAPGTPDVPPHQAVANARYTPEAEAGIDAYMKTAKVGRAKAIEALKASGRLK